MDEKSMIAVLEQPGLLEWRAHGIGFIKAYLDEARTLRMNIYNKMFVTPGVTLHHDHPWHLFSTVWAGVLTNIRYERVTPGALGAELFNEGVINCGDFKGLEAPPTVTALAARLPETYVAGQAYEQRSEEIHATTAIDGTVTVLKRGPVTDGTARVFWTEGTEWIDANHVLKEGEVEQAVAVALRQLKETARE